MSSKAIASLNMFFITIVFPTLCQPFQSRHLLLIIAGAPAQAPKSPVLSPGQLEFFPPYWYIIRLHHLLLYRLVILRVRADSLSRSEKSRIIAVTVLRYPTTHNLSRFRTMTNIIRYDSSLRGI
ncbi:hypothetical protein F5146DRAFT_377282 [Armillaria mellea]|nr:hypothetical protein F5146DRAFT_377282 [Armillaria mellea]